MPRPKVVAVISTKPTIMVVLEPREFLIDVLTGAKTIWARKKILMMRPRSNSVGGSGSQANDGSAAPALVRLLMKVGRMVATLSIIMLPTSKANKQQKSMRFFVV